jgi:FlaA1/EpsC-like NDP-sugar epimerase
MKDRIFISYAREDLDLAERLYTDLIRAGLEPWFDKKCLFPGQTWGPHIKRAIRESDFFLALLSSKSVSKRGYVQRELKEALDVLDEFPENEIFIIPARLDNCKPSHEKIYELHWVDLFPSYDDGLRNILEATKLQIQVKDTNKSKHIAKDSYKYKHVALESKNVKLDEAQIRAYIENQTVMVTGAGRTLGSELCRQICRFKPSTIILFEREESSLHSTELELRHKFANVRVVSILGDIHDRLQVQKAFENNHPTTVFHVASYNHVLLLESHPWKAIEGNVLATKNLIEISANHDVERFVFVSSDKAVRPTNVMGASKRLAEKLVQSQNKFGSFKKRFMIVRIGDLAGNVGTYGSLFRKQIEKGGPVTVTHPEVVRYLMTIPEACQLILQSGAMGEGGEIFILEMGTPIKIDDLARNLIRRAGLEPDVDIEIAYIGLTPGERLYEELIMDDEGLLETHHDRIMELKTTGDDLKQINLTIDELSELVKEQNSEKIKLKLKEILPEYQI